MKINISYTPASVRKRELACDERKGELACNETLVSIGSGATGYFGVCLGSRLARVCIASHNQKPHRSGPDSKETTAPLTLSTRLTGLDYNRLVTNANSYGNDGPNLFTRFLVAVISNNLIVYIGLIDLSKLQEHVSTLIKLSTVVIQGRQGWDFNEI